MKLSDKIRLVSVLAYLFIILNGQTASPPLVLFLLFSLANTGVDTLLAMLALMGLYVIFFRLRKLAGRQKLWMASGAFVLLLMPLAGRLVAVPVHHFLYPGFMIPAVSFFVLYGLSLYYGWEET